MTLVEVMIVVAMIGVLAAVAIAGYRKYIDWAQTAETKDLINALTGGQEAYYADAEGYLDCSTDWSAGALYPMVPNAKKHPFNNPGHGDYPCYRRLNVAVAEPTYMSFWVRAGIPSTSFVALPGDMQAPAIPASFKPVGRPWYIVIAVGDQDEDTKYSYYMTSSGAPAVIHAEQLDE